MKQIIFTGTFKSETTMTMEQLQAHLAPLGAVEIEQFEEIELKPNPEGSAKEMWIYASPAEISAFDVLFSDACEGLREFYPSGLTPEGQSHIKARVCEDFQFTGNNQSDYERLRDAIERALKPKFRP